MKKGKKIAAVVSLIGSMAMGFALAAHADESGDVGIASFYRLTDLSQALQMTATGIYEFKANFLLNVAQAIDSGPAIGGITLDDPGIAVRAFVLNSLDPFFTSIHSVWFEKHIVNQYELSKQNQDHKLRIHGMADIPKRPEIVGIALQELKSGWLALRPFLTSEADRATCEAIVGSIGRTMATNDLGALDLSAGDSILDSLSAEPRTGGLAILVRSVSLYLK